MLLANIFAILRTQQQAGDGKTFHGYTPGSVLTRFIQTSSVTPAVTLDKTKEELMGAGSSLSCQDYKKTSTKNSHGVCPHISISQQLILGFRNKTWVMAKNENDTILTHSLTQFYYFQYLSIIKNRTNVKLQLL